MERATGQSAHRRRPMRKATAQPSAGAESSYVTAAQMEMAYLKKRSTQMLLLREQGQTYARIGEHFNISRNRARQIAIKAQRERALAKNMPFRAMLSYRTSNVLISKFGAMGFTDPRIIVQCGSDYISRLRNMGSISLREIELALLRLGYLVEGQEW